MLTGRYRCCGRTVAYRGDYCLSCDCHTVSEQNRTLDILHVYFLPILPLGFRKHWHCTKCKNDPHARVQTSNEFKILGVMAFSALAVLSWLIPMEQPDDVAVVWTMRIGGICVASVFAISVLVHKPSLTQQEKMGEIPRFSPENCLVCGEELDDSSRECVQCRVEYL